MKQYKYILYIVFVVLIAVSCNKTYRYIEVVEVSAGNTKFNKQLPVRFIESKSPKEAYLIGYTYYCIASKAFQDSTEADYLTLLKPIGFNVFDESGKDISQNITFEQKQEAEDAIRQQIFSSENLLIYVQQERAKLNAEIEKKNELKQESLSKVKKLLKVNYDDITNTNWYYHKQFTHYTNSNRISLYIGERDNNVWLRLKMSYNGDDWIFFENAYISYDGNTQPIYFDRYDERNTEINNGSVSEWLDVNISEDREIIDFLRDFAKSTQAKMRLSGKYSKTRTLTQSERQGILDVLEGYNILIQK